MTMCVKDSQISDRVPDRWSREELEKDFARSEAIFDECETNVTEAELAKASEVSLAWTYQNSGC
jgi:hypothetical protein